MRKFEENNILENSVKNDNLIEIKATLLDAIMVFKGNKEEITKAVSYATENSSFEFELHDDKPITTLKEEPTAYAIESYNMVVNFSKERYYALIDLYLEKYGNDKSNAILNPKFETDIIDNQSENKTIKYIAYGIAAVTVGYFIYKLVD